MVEEIAQKVDSRRPLPTDSGWTLWKVSGGWPCWAVLNNYRLFEFSETVHPLCTKNADQQIQSKRVYSVPEFLEHTKEKVFLTPLWQGIQHRLLTTDLRAEDNQCNSGIFFP